MSGDFRKHLDETLSAVIAGSTVECELCSGSKVCVGCKETYVWVRETVVSLAEPDILKLLADICSKCDLCNGSGLCSDCDGAGSVGPQWGDEEFSSAVFAVALGAIFAARKNEDYEAMHESIDWAEEYSIHALSISQPAIVQTFEKMRDNIERNQKSNPDLGGALTEDELRDLGVVDEDPDPVDTPSDPRGRA